MNCEELDHIVVPALGGAGRGFLEGGFRFA